MALETDSTPTVIIESDDSAVIQETIEEVIVLVEEELSFVIEVEPDSIVEESVEYETIEIIDSGPQGAAGVSPSHRWVGTSLQLTNPDGSWGDLVDLAGASAVAYAKQVDMIDDTHWYIGEAAPGSTTNLPVWRINYNVLNAEGDLSRTWADTANFSQIWDDRLSLAYT